MSAYRNAWVVDDTSSEQRLSLAAVVLERCDGVIMRGGAIALWAAPIGINCEVIDPMANAHRCAEEFKVLVENARLDFASSKLGRRLPSWPLRWTVVQDCGMKTVQFWPS